MGLAGGVAGHHRARRAVEADAGDLSRIDVIVGQGKPDRIAGGRPPLERLLLGPCRPRIARLDRRDADGNGSTVRVDQGRPQALGSDVQAQKERWSSQCCVAMGNDLVEILRCVYSDFRLSSRNVTGPSFTSSTCIMARKTPVATSRPDSASRSVQSR